MGKVVVVGENAVKMMTVGGGSSSLKVKYELSPLDGIRNRLAGKADVVYVRGYVGDPSGEYNGVVTGQNLKDDRSAEELIAEAVREASDADCVIFIGGLNKSAHQDCEDSDREGLELPYGQDDVIRALAKVNPNLVVINISGNAVAMPWAGDVAAILQGWYLGTEAGNSIAAVLTGDVNPSGKLPMTFPAKLDDVAVHKLGLYPGTPRGDGSKTVDCNYDEGIFVGYRWAEKNDIKPLFPFGHGLSYTDFKYGKAKVDKSTLTHEGKVTVTVPVTNVGAREGSEVVQLYIADIKSSVPRPVKELKGFRKVRLAPSETAEVSFEITPEALSYFDADSHSWVCEPGAFEALVGSSSADIRGKVRFSYDDSVASR